MMTKYGGEDLRGLCKTVLLKSHDVLQCLGEGGKREARAWGVRDISTIGDRAVAHRVRQILLRENFPAFFCDEELGVEKLVADPDYTVVLDDIDGTNNYHRGKGALPYCTSVAIFDKPLKGCAYRDVIAAGVIEHNSVQVWAAARDLGCYSWRCARNSSSTLASHGLVRISDKKAVDRKTVVAIEGYESRRQIRRFEKIFDKAWVKDVCTSALELAGVACGIFDAFIHPRHKKDELPAGYLLVREAGGSVTDFKDKPIDDLPYVYEKTARQDIIAAATPELGRELSRMIGN